VVVRSIVCLGLALVFAFKFTALLMILVPVVVFLIAMVSIIIKKYIVKEVKAYGFAGKIAQEILSSIRTVVALGLEKISSMIYAENLREGERLAIRKSLLVGIYGSVGFGILYSFLAFTLPYSIYLVNNDCNYKPGRIMQSMQILYLITATLAQVFPFFREINEARVVAKKIFDIIELKSLIDVFDAKNASRGLKMKKLNGSVEFKNVKFSYPQRRHLKILNDLSFKINAGNTIAICGSR
jgi:ATP-binding cassette, subfamily B (MDR/TAP), member 1